MVSCVCHGYFEYTLGRSFQTVWIKSLLARPKTTERRTNIGVTRKTDSEDSESNSDEQKRIKKGCCLCCFKKSRTNDSDSDDYENHDNNGFEQEIVISEPNSWECVISQ